MKGILADDSAITADAGYHGDERNRRGVGVKFIVYSLYLTTI
jgi:hypothetical protein